MVIDSYFLLFTGLNGLEMSVVTLIVKYILYAVDPSQIPILSLTLLLTIYILFPFLVQIPPLTWLHSSRPFALAFSLTLPFQILSSTSKIFSVLNLLLLPYLVFFLSLLVSFLCFSLFPGFFHTRVDISSFLPPLSSS